MAEDAIAPAAPAVAPIRALAEIVDNRLEGAASYRGDTCFVYN